MPDSNITNTTPLIALMAAIGNLDILRTLYTRVVGPDNFSTGHFHNLEQVKALLTLDQWNNFRFIEGAYVAVIRKWIAALTKGDPVYINCQRGGE